MEYFPMGDLQKYLDAHAPLPENDTCQIICQVLRGLSVMHEEGFAHRDIKPKVCEPQETQPSLNGVGQGLTYKTRIS